MKSLKKVLIYIIFIISLAILGSVLINKFAPQYLLLPSDNILTLTLTVWQIQALFTSIVIAINALTLGFVNKKVYGIDVLEFSFIRDKTYNLSQLDLIIILFLITFLNYFFVAYESLFGVVFLFAISVLCIAFVFLKTLKLITQFKDIRNKIKSFILGNFSVINSENDNLQLIENISEHNKILYINNQIDEVVSNSYLLLDMRSNLSSNRKNKIDDDKQVTLQKRAIEKELIEIIKLLFARNEIEEALKINYEVLKYSFKKKDPIQIEREFFHLLFKQLKYIEYLPIEFTRYFDDTISLMNEYVSFLTNEESKDNPGELMSYDKSLVAQIISTIYSIIYKNKNMNYEEKKSIYRLLRDFVYFKSSSDYNNYYLMFLLRQTILQKDTKTFNFFLSNFNFDTF